MQQTWSAAFGTRANEARFFPLRAARPSLPVGCPSAARSLPVRCPPAGRRDAAAVSACMRMRAVGRGGQSAAPAAAAAAATGGSRRRGSSRGWRTGALEAVGGAWRAQNSPGAHRSHGAHGGRAASWEHSRGGIRRGGISSRLARRRLELLEKLGDGAGGGVGGGAEAALRGAATRWPWWADLTEDASVAPPADANVPATAWVSHAHFDFTLQAFQ